MDFPLSAGKPFIESNTTESSFDEIKENHLIPVYALTNEPLISRADFINAAATIVKDVYNGECILSPQVRVSHIVKGRIAEAKDKPANQLSEWEKTIYYERMALAIEIPSIQNDIDGNTLSLTIGGVKSYSSEKPA